MKIATIKTLIPLIFLTACTGLTNGPTVEKSNAPLVSSSDADTTAITTQKKQAQPIKVQVILTAKAEAAINAGETIIVSASYFASPKPGADLPEEWRGYPWITLAVTEHEITKPGIVNLPTPEFDSDALQWTLPDSYGVNINVGSGRKKSDDNILDCEMFQDSLKVATKEVIPLNCDLL